MASLLRWLLLICCLMVVERVRAERPVQDAACQRLPFAQEVDLDVVSALAQELPQALLARIAALGIDVKRVPSARPDRPVNPLLAGLPVADERLLEQAEFRESYEGRAIPAEEGCSGLPRAAVLIRDTASTYTLLHEVVHLLIIPADGVLLRADLERRFAAAFRRLNVYQRRLYDDPLRLLNPLWRRDIVDAQRDVASLLFDRLAIGQSQEAIVEKVLASCVDIRSPYYHASRSAEGRRYGEAMINSAVDVFNALNASVEFGDDSVRQLHADLVAGRLDEVPGAKLTAEDQAAFAASLREVRDELARVRKEIESLKRFYLR